MLCRTPPPPPTNAMLVKCHCGVLLTAELDGLLDDQRELRQKQRLGNEIAAHVQKFHKEDLARVAVISAQVCGFVVMCGVEGDDQFTAWREEMRIELQKLFEPAISKVGLT